MNVAKFFIFQARSGLSNFQYLDGWTKQSAGFEKSFGCYQTGQFARQCPENWEFAVERTEKFPGKTEVTGLAGFRLAFYFLITLFAFRINIRITLVQPEAEVLSVPSIVLLQIYGIRLSTNLETKVWPSFDR